MYIKRVYYINLNVMTPRAVAIVEKIVRVVFHPTHFFKYSFLQKVLATAALLVVTVVESLLLVVTNAINALFRGTFCVTVITI